MTDKSAEEFAFKVSMGDGVNYHVVAGNFIGGWDTEENAGRDMDNLNTHQPEVGAEAELLAQQALNAEKRDAINSASAREAKLVEALERIRDSKLLDYGDSYEHLADDVRGIARTALESHRGK